MQFWNLRVAYEGHSCANVHVAKVGDIGGVVAEAKVLGKNRVQVLMNLKRLRIYVKTLR